MELSLRFIDLWKKMKVATNETQKFDITIIEMKSQSKLTTTFSHTPSQRGVAIRRRLFTWGKRGKHGKKRIDDRSKTECF